MPADTVIEQRDRALIALALLTGCRDGALASLMLQHVDLGASRLILDARDVKTKFGKTFVTTFFPVGGNARQIDDDFVLASPAYHGKIGSEATAFSARFPARRGPVADPGP